MGGQEIRRAIGGMRRAARHLTPPPCAGCRRRLARGHLAAGFLAILVTGGGCRTTDSGKSDPAPEAPPQHAPEAPAPEGPAGSFHVVKKGDTLWAIAQSRKISVEELIEVNGLEENGLIAPGQMIFIPDDDPLALAPEEGSTASLQPDTAELPPITTTADLMWPIIDGVILRDFTRTSTPYDGILLAAPAGTPVAAADAGKVLYVGDEGSAFGTVIILEHANDLVTVYAHLDGVDVESGQVLARGATIGRVGSSGRAESPQLHFQVREARTPVNPLTHLPPP